jgi:hypothetical protein
VSADCADGADGADWGSGTGSLYCLEGAYPLFPVQFLTPKVYRERLSLELVLVLLLPLEVDSVLLCVF